MNILVTGGSGYIGSLLVKELRKAHAVKVVDLRLLPYPSDGVEFMQGDIRDEKLMVKALNDIQVIVHLAAVVPPHPTLESQMMDINNRATCNLFTLAQFCEAERFIFSSTCSVYGNGQNLTELDKPKFGINVHAPDTPYVSSKIAVERLLMNTERPSCGDLTAPTVLRFATVFGSSPRTGWQSLFNTFVKDAFTKKVLELKHPNAYRPFCHVTDIVRGIQLAIIRSETSWGIWNVGGINATKMELASIIAGYVPNLEIKNLGGDDTGYSVNFDKIGQMGFHTTKTMPMGIGELITELRGD